MDTKMWDTPLIQEKWEPKVGDHWYDSHGTFNVISHKVYGPIDHRAFLRKEYDAVFIPRQEDIQGWLMEVRPSHNEENLLDGFYGWVSRRQDEMSGMFECSLTEIWLHFYMSTHDLQWNGKEWA